MVERKGTSENFSVTGDSTQECPSCVYFEKTLKRPPKSQKKNKEGGRRGGGGEKDSRVMSYTKQFKSVEGVGLTGKD